MAYSGNPTARQFRADMLKIAEQLKGSLEDSIVRQAEELMDNMRANVAEDTGALKRSIRRKNITARFGNLKRVSVLVMAGGPTTTRRNGRGEAYDYALSVEFGDINEPAKPFFYSAARLYQQAARQLAEETVSRVLEENNKVRALRARNYSTGTFTRSVGGRGGATVTRGRL